MAADLTRLQKAHVSEFKCNSWRLLWGMAKVIRAYLEDKLRLDERPFSVETLRAHPWYLTGAVAHVYGTNSSISAVRRAAQAIKRMMHVSGWGVDERTLGIQTLPRVCARERYQEPRKVYAITLAQVQIRAA